MLFSYLRVNIYFNSSMLTVLTSLVNIYLSPISRKVGSNSTIRHLPATEDDPKQRKPDITTGNRTE